MHKLLLPIFLFFALLTSAQLQASEVSYDVLCYHDVDDIVDGNLEHETTKLSTKHLASHLAWLSDHGYHPVSVDNILDAQKGIKPLPQKPVLLTFDDGYVSFYTHVYPLLKLFNYPAVFALVGSWLEAEATETVDYGGKQVPRSNFLSTAQIKEMAKSGLIEFSSHSYNLHHGVLLNPHNSTAAAAITRQYFPNTQRYETKEAYSARIQADLKRNNNYIKQLTGKSPRVMTWPYGKYNQVTLAIAKQLGMPINLTLDDNFEHPNNIHDLTKINRALIDGNPSEGSLVGILKKEKPVDQQRIMHIDLDYLYDDDEVQMQKNFDVLIERVKSLAPSTVYLQAFADSDGDGTASALYFQNRHLPVRADIFSRVSRQIETRTDAKVYAWMPVLAFDLKDKALQAKLSVKNLQNQPNQGDYRRLSPFSQQARTIIKEIYEDLASHATLHGIVFHDDATLSDEEDNSSFAQAVYKQQWNLPSSIAEINTNKSQKDQWTTLKSRWVTDFTIELANVVKQYHPALKTSRNLYASVMLKPESEQWLAQNYEDFLSHYDYTAVMAMPKLEKVEDYATWFKALIHRAEQSPNGIRKTIFEVQSYDWTAKQPISNDVLADQFSLLLNNGAAHIGYYSDDFIQNHPRLEDVRPYMSTRSFPYLQN